MKKIKNLLTLVIIFIVSFNIKDVYAKKDCYYYTASDKTNPYFSFTINDNSTVGNATGYGTYEGLTISFSGSAITDCPPYIRTEMQGSTIRIYSSTTQTGYILGNNSSSNSSSSSGNSQVGTGQPQDVFVTYLPYNGSGDNIDKIIVKKENGSFKFYLYKKKSGWLPLDNTDPITVDGLNDFLEAFQEENVDNYPTWINSVEDENGKTISYKLSKTRDELAKTSYICQPKILSVSGQTENDTETCETLFGSDFLKFLNNNVFTIVRLAIPLLLILFTTFDFAKVVFIDDKDGIQKAGKRFGKRIVAAILVFLIPQILIWLADIIGADKVNECAEWMQNNQSTINDISDNE